MRLNIRKMLHEVPYPLSGRASLFGYKKNAGPSAVQLSQPGPGFEHSAPSPSATGPPLPRRLLNKLGTGIIRILKPERTGFSLEGQNAIW